MVRFHINSDVLNSTINENFISALTNCPMPTVRAIIQRAYEASGPEAALQMQVGDL